jgi:hypothetical protein
MARYSLIALGRVEPGAMLIFANRKRTTNASKVIMGRLNRLVRTVALPDGHDPNSFFVRDGDARQFQSLLEAAQ